jgi:hypothetical protein
MARRRREIPQSLKKIQKKDHRNLDRNSEKLKKENVDYSLFILKNYHFVLY